MTPGGAQAHGRAADAAYERLCELARRDAWRLEELPWHELDVSDAPEELRQVAADAIAQLHWGERTAHLAAQRVARLLPEGAARRFALTQVEDEARHVAFFGKLMDVVGCEGRVRESVRALMAQVEAADTPELLLAGMQILIEGVAHALFVELSRVAKDAGELEGAFASSMLRVVGDWMPRLLGRDESRHIAFGLACLEERIPKLDAGARAALEARAADWGRQVRAQAEDPDLLFGLGVDGATLCARLIDDLNLRLAQVGLTTRIAPLGAA